ncbi:MAG: hypothetical protein RLY89_2676 [Bacteroidota bacterium]|jgi:hypothetical protein
MKSLLALFFLSFMLLQHTSMAQQHGLTKLWETDTIFRTPESVLFDGKGKRLFVSNIDGAPAEKDGKGFISIVGLDGKPISLAWIKGLNAPKGMGIYKNKLYVADLTELVVIDIKQAVILEKIPIEGAVFLNDIVIDNKGIVFVSDTRSFNVYQYDQERVSVTMRNLKRPNGLLMNEKDLLILDNGSLLALNLNGQLLQLMEGMDPSTDGIERVKADEYIVSAWEGVIYYVIANKTKEILLDTRKEKKNTADIGYDAKNRIIYVPTFFGNKLVAYKLD